MSRLFINQQKTFQLHERSPIVFDMSDPGTGKTVSALEAYSKLVYPRKMLVDCTRTTMDPAWAADAREFYPELRLVQLSAETRMRSWLEDADIYVINHDGVKWLAERLPEFKKRFKDGMLANDESSYYKHRTSQRSKALMKLRPVFERVTNLTGTPDTNAITDMWHQAYILDYGRRLGKSFYAFRAATQDPVPTDKSGRFIKWVDKEGAELAVAQRLRDITIRHLFEECFDIPPDRVRPVKFTLPAKLRKAYDTMERQAVLLFENGKLVDAVHAGAVVNKLLQIASGAVYTSERDYELIDASRYELVADLVEERPHSIVFFLWWHQRREIERQLAQREISYRVIDGTITSKSQRDTSIEMFKAGALRVLLMHPMSAAHGLSLVRGTATIWPTPTYNLEWWLQGIKRIRRPGQTQPTETIIVTAKDTREERVAQAMAAKNKRQMSLLELFR